MFSFPETDPRAYLLQFAAVSKRSPSQNFLAACRTLSLQISACFQKKMKRKGKKVHETFLLKPTESLLKLALLSFGATRNTGLSAH